MVQFKGIVDYTTAPIADIYYDTLYVQPDHLGAGKDKNWVYMVAPGVDERCSPVNPSEHSMLMSPSRIHTLKIHLHPYANYVKLVYKDGSLIWQGNTTTTFLENGEPVVGHADSIFSENGVQTVACFRH
jgi:hypothetical protein